MHRLVVAIVLAGFVTGGQAWADTAQQEHPEGVYTGAKPGVRPGADTGKPQKPPARATLSWIGFEAKDGGATVWLQAGSSFEISQRVEGGTLVVEISGLRRMVRNVRRPVDTRFFDNPLARISAKVVGARRARKGTPARKAGIEVRIAFKNATDARDASVRTATEADGLFYTYLTFPPGTEAEAGAAAVDRDASLER
jgi:hypothetical protein